MLEYIFEIVGSAYQLDTKTGLFTRDGGGLAPIRFIGSVDPKAEVGKAFGHSIPVEELDEEIVVRALLADYFNGHTRSFYPLFLNGYLPFGINCEPSEITHVGNGQVGFSDGLKGRVQDKDSNLIIALGSPIIKIYRQLRSEERGYRVLKPGENL